MGGAAAARAAGARVGGHGGGVRLGRNQNFWVSIIFEIVLILRPNFHFFSNQNPKAHFYLIYSYNLKLKRIVFFTIPKLDLIKIILLEPSLLFFSNSKKNFLLHQTY